MRASLSKKDPLTAVFLACTAVYLLSIFWINFHSGPWYNFDMYADATVARLMAEGKTLFPQNWVYGNSYYVVATPVLAALLYPLCGESVLAMSVASCVMTLLVLAAFAWCCAPFLSRHGIAVGLFCLIGAILPADSAANNRFGLQVFYTMASYYACYLWGLLFHLGIYLRLRRGMKVHPLLPLLALLLSVCFGMQSLRATLVLNIPLVMLDLLCLWRLGKNRRATLFALSCLAANLAGTRLIRLFPVENSTIIAPVQLSLSPSVLSERLSICLTGLSEISGLCHWHDAVSRKPLFLAAVFVWLAVLAALILALRRRDRSPAAGMLLFCLLSLACVCGVAVFLFNTRGRYYFVWLPFASLCFAYLADLLPKGRLRSLLLTALLLCGMGVYVYHFVPDFKDLPAKEAFYSELADELSEEGVDTLYVDFLTQPVIAACSHDRILAGTFQYDFEGGACKLHPCPHLLPKSLFEDPDPAHSLVVLLASGYESIPSLTYIRRNATPEAAQGLMERLQPLRTETLGETSYLFYRFNDPDLFA